MKRIGLLFLLAVFALGTAASAQTQIEFWHAFGDEARSGWIEERAAEWNAEHPDFEVVPASKGSYRETLNAAILAARQGNPPHIVQIFEVGTQLALDSGLFVPVGNIGEFDTSDYIPAVLDYYTIGDTIHSIPYNSSNPILYLNKDLMAEAGIEEAPQTYSEMLAACGKVEAADIEATCWSMSLNSWFFEQWMAEQGAPLVNNDNGRSGRATEVLLTSDAALNIVNWWKEMNDKGYYVYTGTLEDWSGSDAIFTEGQAVFHITSTADIGNNFEAVGDKFEMGTALLPVPDDSGRHGVIVGGGSVWVMKDHPQDELEAARDFILYMTNTENMVSWHKLTGYFPVRQSSVDALQAEGWFESHPLYEVAFNQMLETQPGPATAGAVFGPFPEVRTLVEQAIQKVLNGADVEEAMAEAKRLAEAELEQYNANFQ